MIRRGVIDRVGTGGVADHGAAVTAMFDELDRRGAARPAAVGHRLVHGGPESLRARHRRRGAARGARRAVPFAPLHLPAELAAIDAVRARFGDLPQVACFDTAFHRTLPEVARRFRCPPRCSTPASGATAFTVCRTSTSRPRCRPTQLRRAVIAHLGSGASMVAIRDGRSIDTTMGLTPTGGLVMGTRSGDLDPACWSTCSSTATMRAALEHLVDHEAGLLALSGTTADMQQLLALRATDPRAALASTCSATRRGRRSARSPRCSAASTRSCSPAASASTRRRARGDLSRPRASRDRARRRQEQRGRVRDQHGVMRGSRRRDRRGADDRAPHATARKLAGAPTVRAGLRGHASSCAYSATRSFRSPP